MMLQPGSYLQDRYEILAMIGVGGMSEVYQAKCHKLNRLVAIKLLKEEFSQDSNFVSKFKMEAQAAAGLSHPNIVSVYDVVDEGDLHYIVMELIEGITLKSYILKKNHLGVKETIGIAIQVAQGIAAAHDQHIVHRDIKPQNMIISRDGKVKVADFGIARAVSSQTIGSNAVGSVHYISPEQAKGGYSDARSDLYSLGITMYEMVTGQVPFDGDNTVTIALAHLEEPVLPPSRLNRDVTPSLERIILKCTAKKPERRYQDAYELIADLRHALVDPEDEYLKPEPQLDESSPTVIRDQGEVEYVRDTQRRNTSTNHGEGWDDGIDVPVIRREPRTPAAPPARKKKKDPSDDVNPQIEKIMTTIGIIAAVIIVAVVLVIFARLGGIFNLGSGKTPDKSTESSVQTEETLNSTECKVPQLLGLSAEQAETTLKDAFLKIRYEYDDSEDEKEGLVISQSVLAGTIVSKQSEIVVTVGLGSGRVDLTKMGLTEMTAEEAKQALEAQKLLVELQDESSETIEKGKVLRFDPEKAEPGSTVKLFVSSGPAIPLVPMIEITGMSEEDAKTALEAIGLTLGERKEEKSEDVAKGMIISQDILAPTDTPQGTAVGYTVSTGKGKQYIAVINDDFPLKDLFGPSSGDMQIQVRIIAIQDVDGRKVEKELMPPRTMGGNITIPVHYRITGEPGVLTGELQIQDLSNDKILKSYPLEFLEVDE